MLRLCSHAALAVGVLAAAACRDAPVASPPPFSVASPPSPPRYRTLADEYRDLARRVPAFTGIFFDEAGRLTISHASPGLTPADLQEITTRASRWSGAVRPGDPARLVRREFSYLTLDSVYLQVLGPALREIPAVTSSGIEETLGRVRVTAETPAALGQVRQLAARLGVTERMLDLALMPRASLPELEAECFDECDGGGGGAGGGGGGGGDEASTTLLDALRPVTGGVQISWDDYTACSLGFAGYRVNHSYIDPSLGKYFLTAAHCGSRLGGVDGFTWGQPSKNQNPFGVDVWSAPILSDSQCPNRYPRCTLADVMVIRAFDSVATGYGTVARTPLFSIFVTGLTGVSGQVYGALTGETVYKVGRTTGTTSGRITRSCIDINSRSRLDLYVLCTQQASYPSDYGDSGAPVFIPFDPARANVTPRTVGIHFGGVPGVWPPEVFFSPIGMIWQAQDYQYWW